MIGEERRGEERIVLVVRLFVARAGLAWERVVVLVLADC